MTREQTQGSPKGRAARPPRPVSRCVRMDGAGGADRRDAGRVWAGPGQVPRLDMGKSCDGPRRSMLCAALSLAVPASWRRWAEAVVYRR